MDSKGKQETIVYPHVVFPIDDFDNVSTNTVTSVRLCNLLNGLVFSFQAFSDCVLRDSECLCIEMAAYDRFGALQGVLFEAVVRYSTLKKAHDVQVGRIVEVLLFSGSHPCVTPGDDCLLACIELLA